VEDAKIVKMYLDRDETALSETAEKYGARLRSLSYRITKDSQTAEECENDTYLEAWKRIPPNDPGDHLFAFLARITRALSVDRCRERTRLKRRADIVELTAELETCIPSGADVADEVAAKQLGEAISRYLYTLSDEKQVMFVRRYFYTDSISEIAVRLSIGESKVKTTLFRIRNGLRDFLVKEGYTL